MRIEPLDRMTAAELEALFHDSMHTRVSRSISAAVNTECDQVVKHYKEAWMHIPYFAKIAAACVQDHYTEIETEQAGGS